MSSGEQAQIEASAEAQYGADERWIEVAPGLALPSRFSHAPRLASGPTARLYLRVLEGRVVCERLEVLPRSEAEPLTAQRLRDVPFGRLMQEAPREVARAITFDPAHPDGAEEVRRARPLPSTLAALGLPPGVLEMGAWLLADPREVAERTHDDEALAVAWPSMSRAEVIDAIRGLPSPQARALSDDERAVAEGASATPRRRQPLTDAELREMAEEHQRQAKTVRDPTVRVAAAFHMSRSTASRHLRRARRLGYL